MGMVLWATGRRVTEVSAFMSNRDLAVDLVDAIAYRLDNGAVGTMGVDRQPAPGPAVAAGVPLLRHRRATCSRTCSPARSSPTSTTAPARRSNRSTADEIFPAAATSRGFADLIAGSRREPGTGATRGARRRVPRGRLPIGGRGRRSGSDRWSEHRRNHRLSDGWTRFDSADGRVEQCLLESIAVDCDRSANSQHRGLAYTARWTAAGEDGGWGGRRSC